MKLKLYIRVASQVMSQRIIIIILVNIIGVRVRMHFPEYQYPHMFCECDTVSSIINKRNRSKVQSLAHLHLKTPSGHTS